MQTIVLLFSFIMIFSCGQNDSNSTRKHHTLSEVSKTEPKNDNIIKNNNDTNPISLQCKKGEMRCSNTQTEQNCTLTSDNKWQYSSISCQSHQYCLKNSCQSACLDECAIADKQTVNGELKDCRIFSEKAQSFIEPSQSLLNKARKHYAWTKKFHLANGYIANRVFNNPTHEIAQGYTGTVDAAEWTGMFASAIAFEALATKNPEALREVDVLIDKIEELFTITRNPGYMARFWAPLGKDRYLDSLYKPQEFGYHETRFNNQKAFWHGWTSQDMYQGIFMSLPLLYESTQSQQHKNKIKNIVLQVAEELMKTRQVKVNVRMNVSGLWLNRDIDYTLENVILIPSEMTEGKVSVQLGTEQNPTDYTNSELKGAREFFPDFSVIARPIIGQSVPSIPRAGAALFLANVFELALHILEREGTDSQKIKLLQTYYDSKKNDWLDIMKKYTFFNESSCWKQYFGLTLAHHPIYNIMRLSKDENFKSSIRKEVWIRIRSYVKDHHNVYFDFIAGAYGKDLIPLTELNETIKQFRFFPDAPRTSYPVDNRNAYEPDSSCPNLAAQAVAIKDRVPMDFQWQHHPFRLQNEYPDVTHAYPGSDFLVAYWMGRYHGLIENDDQNTCTRWD